MTMALIGVGISCAAFAYRNDMMGVVGMLGAQIIAVLLAWGIVS